MRTALAALIFCIAAPALAQNASLLRPDTLRKEPFADAAAVSPLRTGDPVRIVERKGTWFLVEGAGKRGWLRALNLKPDAPAGLKREGVLALETGRQAQGGVSVPLAIRNAPIPGLAARLLADIYDARDKPRELKLSARRASDGSLSLDVQSPRPGYAYVFMAGNAGDALQCVFPNAAQPDNDLAAGKTVSLPSGSWKVNPEGPARLLAVVTDAPLDLLIPDKQADGPLFKVSVTDENHDALAAALSGGKPYGAAATTVPGRR
jgi:hypothetical protein